jgi:hypothetical protein
MKTAAFIIFCLSCGFMIGKFLDYKLSDPAIYFNQKNSNNDRYTQIKNKLSDQDSVTLRHDTLFFWKNNTECSICISDSPGGITIK